MINQINVYQNTIQEEKLKTNLNDVILFPLMRMGLLILGYNENCKADLENLASISKRFLSCLLTFDLYIREKEWMH